MKFTDEEIINAIKEGKNYNKQVEFLYLTNYNKISRMVMDLNGTLEEGEEVLQDAIIEMVKFISSDKFKREGAKLNTILYAIAKNIWIDELKKRNRKDFREAHLEALYEMEIDIEDQNIRKKLIEKLNEELKGDCKELLIMFYFERLSMSEILKHDTFKDRYQDEHTLRNKKHKCWTKFKQIINDLKESPNENN